MAKLSRAEKALDETFRGLELLEVPSRVDEAVELLRKQRAAVVEVRAKRDNGKCQYCKGDAKVCYARHLAGRSCA
jgi:hypothetical protein